MLEVGAKLGQVKEELRLKVIYEDFSYLVKKKVINEERVENIDEYQKVEIGEFTYRTNYEMYVNSNESKYAFISITTTKKSTIYSIFELDYSKPEQVTELVKTVKSVKKSNSDSVIKTLHIFGIATLVLGLILSVIVLDNTEEIFNFITIIIGAVLSATFIFALEAIVYHLQNIDRSVSDIE